MKPATPTGRGWRKLIAMASCVATMCVGAGVATASGGVGVGDAPEPTDVTCIETCAGARQATVGSRVRVTGRNLSSVQQVQFAGAGGRIGVPPDAVTPGAVEATVPDGAVTGTVTVDAYGVVAETPVALEIVPAAAIPEGSGFKLTSAAAIPHKTYFDGRKPPRVSYLFQGLASTAVRIDIVERATKAVVASWVVDGAVANAENVAEWNGIDERRPPRRQRRVQVPDRQRGRRRGRDHGGLPVRLLPVQVSARPPSMATATASAPAAGTRARTCSPTAAPPCAQRAVGACSGTVVIPRPATTW